MSLNKNKTSYNYIFGGNLDVYGRLNADSGLYVHGHVRFSHDDINANLTNFRGHTLFYTANDTGSFIFHTSSDNTERLKITSDGSVIISGLTNTEILGADNTGKLVENDAPSDGDQYVRQNGAWAEIALPTGTDAPVDGNQYVRQDGSWQAIVLPTGTDAPSDGDQYVRQNGAWTQLSTGPVGMIVAYANATIPTGWLECDGSAIPSQYTELKALLGNNVPDLRGEFIRGWDNGRGVDSGRTLGSTQTDAFESHNHSATANSNSSSSITGNTDNHRHSITARKLALNQTLSGNFILCDNNYSNVNPQTKQTGYTNPATTITTNTSTSVSIDNQGDTETRPRNVALIYIIKAEA